jgi:hypothetical protein
MNELQMLYFRLFDCDGLPIVNLGCEGSFILKENGLLVNKEESEMVCLRRVHAYNLVLDVTGSVLDILDLIRESAKTFVTYIFDADCLADKVPPRLHASRAAHLLVFVNHAKAA